MEKLPTGTKLQGYAVTLCGLPGYAIGRERESTNTSDVEIPLFTTDVEICLVLIMYVHNANVYACMYVCVCMYVCMHVCMYVCMYVCIYACMHKQHFRSLMTKCN